MAPTKKYESLTCFIYEKNSFASFVNTEAIEEKEYHKMMNFIKASKLSHAMLSTPTIFNKVVEEIWTSAEFNSEDETISLSLKNNTHVINSDFMKVCFNIPENAIDTLPSDEQLVNLLHAMNYA